MRTAWLLVLFCVCAVALLESGPSKIAKAHGRHIVGAEPDPPGGGEIADPPCNCIKGDAPTDCVDSPSGYCGGPAVPNYLAKIEAGSKGTNNKYYLPTGEQKCKPVSPKTLDCPLIRNQVEANKGKCVDQIVP